MQRLLLTLLLLGCPMLAIAEHQWDLTYLRTMEQGGGESEEQFLMRMGTYLRDYTAQSGFEACASICTSPKGQGAMFFTGKSQIFCPVTYSCPDETYTLTPKSIHSHPPHARVTLNALDAGLVNAKRKIFKKKPGKAMGFLPWKFSREDYAQGPGYMVNGDRLWIQEGQGTARVLFLLPPSQPQPQATPSDQGLEN